MELYVIDTYLSNSYFIGYFPGLIGGSIGRLIADRTFAREHPALNSWIVAHPDNNSIFGVISGLPVTHTQLYMCSIVVIQ